MTAPNDSPSLTHLLSRSVRVCACGHVKGIHAEDGDGKCRHPQCACTTYRDRIALVTEDAA
jgi:hypothetical protein